MNSVMYLFANRGIGMSPGKLAAQVGHAAVEAYRLTQRNRIGDQLIQSWYQGGHHTKLVMAADNETHLHTIQRYIEDRGFETKLIIDEGRTEIRPHTATALAVQIVDRDDGHVTATFENFELYKEKEHRAFPYKLVPR